mmetsp:Transcript_21745/g.56628  ORF Transcript_21745/g.56628 Transcript_21745/m.56628 type:complete len:121 (-) Transcript_21745:259-621(-)
MLRELMMSTQFMVAESDLLLHYTNHPAHQSPCTTPDSIPSSDGHHGSGQSDDNENRFDNIGVAELMDPDMVAAMQNPRIFEAVKEMMRDPASAMKYTNDPEIAPVLKKMAGQGKPAGSSS